MNNKIRSSLCLLITLSVLSISVGCGSPKTPITIAISNWAGVEPAELAAQLGLYEKHGVQVIIKRFSAYSDSIDALRDGKVDAGMHTLDDAIRSYAANSNVSVVLLTDYSNGGDGLVAQPGINTGQDLHGKKIGVEIGTVGHFSLLKILNIFKLQPTDVTVVSIPAWEIQDSMVKGEIDAGVTWEPFLSNTAQQVKGKVLVTSKEYPEMIITTMNFRKDVIKQRPEDVQKVVAAYFEAIDYLQSNPQDAYARMAKAEGISADEFALTVQGIQYIDLKANANLFGKQSGKDIYAVTQSIAQFLFDQKVIKTLPDTAQMLEPRFVLDLSTQ